MVRISGKRKHQNVRYTKINQYLGAVPMFVSELANITVLMLGVYLVMAGQFAVGMILAFRGFMSSFSAPAQSLINAGQKLQEMRTNMERIEDVMNYETDIDYDTEDILASDESTSFDKLTGEIEMKMLRSDIQSSASPLIENFNLSLKPGSRVAFVGPSGCGKSTISKLVSGLYKLWSGEILFDGKPISEISRTVFTGSLAVVDQDIILFEDTIANNIKMWDTSVEDFEMIMARATPYT